jgi:NAD(P)-dependent dehydrogenase (short-subunit alcohol dehydrogenase family)
MRDSGGGHIVNILSTAAFQGARNITGYVAAKHGLLGLTRAMAVELAPKIHVNAIAPGITETDMIADMTPERRALLESITPAGRFCKPEEIADALMYILNSTGIYGQTITVDGGWLVKNG